MPSYVPPLLGAILGLLLLITLLCVALFYLRRKRQEKRHLQTDSAASEVRKHRQTWSWLLGVNGDEKRDWAALQQPTGVAGQTPPDVGGQGEHAVGGVGGVGAVAAVGAVREEPIEAGGRQLHEMSGEAIAHELPGAPVPARRVTISDTVTEIVGGERRAGSVAQYAPPSFPYPLQSETGVLTYGNRSPTNMSPTNMSPTNMSPIQPPDDHAYLLHGRSASGSSTSNPYSPAPNPYSPAPNPYPYRD